MDGFRYTFPAHCLWECWSSEAIVATGLILNWGWLTDSILCWSAKCSAHAHICPYVHFLLRTLCGGILFHETLETMDPMINKISVTEGVRSMSTRPAHMHMNALNSSLKLCQVPILWKPLRILKDAVLFSKLTYFEQIGLILPKVGIIILKVILNQHFPIYHFYHHYFDHDHKKVSLWFLIYNTWGLHITQCFPLKYCETESTKLKWLKRCVQLVNSG